MAVKWKKDFNPDVILEKLQNIRTLNGEKASFSGFEFHEYIDVLKSMVEVNEDVSSQIAQQLIVRGFDIAAKKQELNQRSVLSSIQKVFREHLKKPNEPYWLLTTINVHSNNDLPSVNINGCSLRFYKHLPKKYREARKSVLSEVASWLIEKDESFSHYVVAHVSHKTTHDAVEKLIDSVDLLRAIWNLHINKQMVRRLSGRRKPINQITLGALHTLHDSSGAGISESYWYEPEYYKNHNKVDFSKNSYKTLEFTKNLRKLLKKNNYRNSVEVGLVRYVRALDSQDYNAVFIKLWSLLEYLTDTLKDSYDKTIRRVVFHYSDRDYNVQVLEHLRQYRNRFVHLGVGENEIDTHVYQLKSYVENMLRFHIVNKFKFETMNDAARFMDLQPDKALLSKKIKDCRDLIKYMGN